MGIYRAPGHQGKSIYRIFVKYRVDSNKIPIANRSTEHMLLDFFMKYFQGYLLVKFCDVIMGWTHIDTLQMGTPSTKECIVNVDKVESSIKSKKIYMGNKKSYTNIVISDKTWITIML